MHINITGYLLIIENVGNPLNAVLDSKCAWQLVPLVPFFYSIFLFV